MGGLVRGGGDDFREHVQGLYAGLVNATRRPKDAALRHVEETLSSDHVLDELAVRLKCERGDFTRRTKGAAYRPFAARYLTRYAGLTQRGVADILGVSTGVAVSLQLQQFEELVGEHPKLRALSRRCDKAFDSLIKAHANKR